MKRIGLIYILFGFLLCSCDLNIEMPQPGLTSSESSLEIVGRIMPFQDVTVTTKTAKEPAESNPKTTMMVVFNSDNECVLCRRSNTGELIFALDRGKDENTGDFIGKVQEKLKDCNIYIIANFPEVFNEPNLDVGAHIDAFTAKTNAVKGITLPENGLPMLGSYNNVDLSRDSDIGAGKPLTVEMQSLFAKVAFHISVDAAETLPYTPQFRIDSWEVHNLVESVDFWGGNESAAGKNGGTNDSTPLKMEAGMPNVFYGRLDGNTTALHGQTNSYIEFSFYLPERYLRAAIAADKYGYPFKQSDGSIREEDKKLMQRYKPDVAAEDATFVRLKGVYKTHQDHSFDVVYDIYVGNDNYGNFDIVRNKLYTNNITIKGISASNQQVGAGGLVTVDHRVDVQHAKPVIIQLRRETLLDSHFEVRPMRIYANGEYHGGVPSNMAIKVEVLNVDGTINNRPSWLRLERSYGGGSANSTLYCTSGSSAGKRKYFTENLVSGIGSGTNSISANTSVIVPIGGTQSGMIDCVWIYADECVSGQAQKDAVRSAMIKVSFGTLNSSTFTPLPDDDLKDVDYIINQAQLYPVATTRKEWTQGAAFDQNYTYLIESQEEYLYNFDSEDTFTSNPVFEDGMEWGLNGIQLSHLNDAFYAKPNQTGNWGDVSLDEQATMIKSALKTINIDPKYDFYLIRDTENSDLKGMEQDFSGYDFNIQIAEYLQTSYSGHQGEILSVEDEKLKTARINGITLAQIPQSAFAYCYNKNKRDENGKVNTIKWYLASIDEIEDIVESDYLAFNGVFQNNMYWSCMPSYVPYEMHFDRYVWAIYQWKDSAETSSLICGKDINVNGEFYVDDIYNARATRVDYLGKDENGQDKLNIPLSGASTYQKYTSGKYYYSTTSSTITGSKNKTVELGNLTYQDDNYNDISKYEGNKPRTGGKEAMARVRCVYKP